jgi:hypothetical protein
VQQASAAALRRDVVAVAMPTDYDTH